MKIKLPHFASYYDRIYARITSVSTERIVTVLAACISISAIIYAILNDWVVLYGDAESHLNIAKRVVHSLTPGIAQVGGIWLPLPHLMMLPFIWIEPLYRNGAAGALVSGFCYVVSCVFLYRLVTFITGRKLAGFVAFVVFGLNLNVLYMQSTPMTEIPLIMFFVLSSYYFIRFLSDQTLIINLVLAAVFGFCATLSRYDGWFLVLIEAAVIVALYIRNRQSWTKLEGLLLMFGSLAFLGVLLWLLWGYLILGNPFYFTNSQFSAKSQQNAWNARGELPAYKSITNSFLYYTFTSLSNVGIIVFGLALAGFVAFLSYKKFAYRYHTAVIMLVPYIFYVVTLYMGQSVIFIPSLTPVSFEWRLFNVRYGIMMVPFAAVFCAYLFIRLKHVGRLLLIGLFVFQYMMYGVNYAKVITFEDGYVGLSHAKRPDAERWIREHYDGGLVLFDDYARTISVVRSDIPMQNIIYIGNKPYWEESLQEPEKYATWIIMQKDDSVWKAIYDDPATQGRLFAHFQKVYTSEEILIFRKITDKTASSELVQ